MLRLLALALSAATARAACKATTLDFMLLEDDSSHAAIEADIRDDLAKIGITVTARPVDKDTFNTDMVAGNYDMVFSKTWGAPYDPHSYVNSWTTTDEGFYSALPTAGIDRSAFEAQVDAALSEMDPAQRQAKWTAILKSVHDEVVALPLYGVRLPHITRRSRLSGYAPGTQNYDYPLHKALVASGSKTVKVSVEGTGGIFTTAGGLEPHATFPMQFFSNNWIYEGLVRYGAGGAVEPALATEWASTVNSDGSETVRFTLRTGVKFHDGTDFNCAAVKLNFDHVMGQDEVRGWYGWYDMPGALKDWSCDGEVFVLNTNKPYYPLMQELAYIRPVVILAPSAFVNGGADPVAENSCPTVYNAMKSPTVVTCVGAASPIGTGPFKFKSRTASADSHADTADDRDITDDLFVVEKNADYWGGAPDIDEVHVVRYADSAAIYDALNDGSLDAVLGIVLDPARVKELQYDDRFEVQHGEETMNHLIIMNIADKEVRKAVVHGVDKNHIIESQLSGFESPTSQIFSQSVPYCDIDLTPKFDYDLEKAELLNCPADTTTITTTTTTTKKKTKKEGMNGFKYGILFMVLVVVALLSGLAFIVMKEKEGEPIFMDVTTKTPMTPTGKVENA